MSTKFLEVTFLLVSLVHVCMGKVEIHEYPSQNNIVLSSADNSVINPLPWRETGSKLRKTRSTDDKKPDFLLHPFPEEKHNQALLYWSGKDDSSVFFMLTRERNGDGVQSSTVYRSANYGRNYTILKMSDREALISYFVVSPLDLNRLVFVDVDNRTIYRTFDEGNTEPEKCGDKLPFVPERLLFSPFNRDHILVYSYSNRSVHVSDMCGNWTLVSENVNSRIFWGVNDTDEAGTIHMEVQDLASNGYRYKKFTPPYTNPPEDMIGVIDIDSLLVVNDYIFVQKSTQFTSHLYVSYKRGEFRRAYFPLDQSPLNFNIVEADESQVFIAANHKEGHVSLYLSDVTGQFYTVSMEDVSAVQWGSSFTADLYEVRGLQGVYIANKHTADGPVTYLTFDQGGAWTKISTPETIDGKPYPCKDKSGTCNLHLHLKSSSWNLNIPSPTSEKNAPGIIIAQGSVGKQLETDSSLFISRDGGLNWIFAHKGDFYHNILDQGGAIVAVNISETDKYSNTILLSVDEGQSWEFFNFSTKRMRVNGVLNEPGISTLLVSIYGHFAKSGWVVVLADFGPLLTNTCGDDDYEFWSPSDPMHKDTRCLLGKKIVYKRQKKGRECKNGEDYTHSINVTSCNPCTREDFECDYGYGVKDGECKALSWFDPSVPVARCDVGQKYNRSTGYRKVASDNCTGGDLPTKFAPKEVDCPFVAPAGLYLSLAGENIVALNEDVTFELIQDEGSLELTQYIWKFDANEKPITHTYEESKRLVHSYGRRGVKTVSVTATNAKGNATASIKIIVEEKLVGVMVEEPHGAQVGVPVQFKASAVINSDSFVDDNDVYIHYVWYFSDEKINKEKPKLTWASTTEHTYSFPGNYTCIVQVSNAISSKFTHFKTVVYGTLVTVQLMFSKEAQEISQFTPVWNNQFAYSVKEAVMGFLDIEPTRLEVVAFTDYETGQPVVDVSILPRKQALVYDPNIEKIATKLADHVNKKNLSIKLDKNDYGKDENIKAVKAVILKRAKNVQDGKGKDLTALYVCLPIAIFLTVAVVFLVVVYYKKKSRTLGGRYRMLRSRSQRPDDGAGTSLLDDEDNTLDDDDDEPLLDPSNAPDTHNRLAINDDDPLGVNSGNH